MSTIELPAAEAGISRAAAVSVVSAAAAVSVVSASATSAVRSALRVAATARTGSGAGSGFGVTDTAVCSTVQVASAATVTAGAVLSAARACAVSAETSTELSAGLLEEGAAVAAPVPMNETRRPDDAATTAVRRPMTAALPVAELTSVVSGVIGRRA
jgi:hypothetical protein